MANLNGFDASSVEPSRSFEPLPEGKYEAVITESEMKDTRAGNGRYLALTLEVVGGDHAGRRLWDRLNLENPNDKAVDIAKATLSAICRALGILKPKDSTELHNKPLVVRVALRRDENGETRNDIKGYESSAASTPRELKAGTQAPRAPWSR
jgi:hypothetical protein